MTVIVVGVLLGFAAGAGVGALGLATHLMRTYGPRQDLPRASAEPTPPRDLSLTERKARFHAKVDQINLKRWPERYYREKYEEAKAIRERAESQLEDAQRLEEELRQKWRKSRPPRS